MATLTLLKTAQRMGISRAELIKRMKIKGILNADNLPARPKEHRAWLTIHEGQWYHSTAGQQYRQTTRVKTEGLRWLAAELDLLPPPPEQDRADVY